MNIVIFLGAGFSRAWGLPVMNDFFRHAANHRLLSAEDKQFLIDIRTKAANANRMLNADFNDFEHILSFALMSQDIDRISTGANEPTASRLRRILARIYGDFTFKDYDKLGASCKHFFDLENMHNQRLTIITTNYDLLPEIMLGPFGASISIPQKWISGSKQPDATNKLYNSGGWPLQLCKLHGSINWFDDPNNSEHFLVYDRRLPGQDGQGNQIILPEACYTKFESPSCPIIVPPTLFKMQSDIRFDAIWRAAGDALKMADRLIFVGYSFPDSDTHMKYFIGAHLALHVDAPEIQLINPDGKNIIERLRKDELFGSHFKKQLVHHASNWEGVKNTWA